jgi:hypothetical protein
MTRLTFFWPLRGLGHAGLLRVRRPEPLVHPRICMRVRIGIDLRIPPGSMAIRAGGSDLGDGSFAALVASLACFLR